MGTMSACGDEDDGEMQIPNDPQPLCGSEVFSVEGTVDGESVSAPFGSLLVVGASTVSPMNVFAETMTRTQGNLPESDGWIYVSTATDSFGGVDSSSVLFLADALGAQPVCSAPTFSSFGVDDGDFTIDVDIGGKLASCADAEPSNDRFEVCIGEAAAPCDAAGGGTFPTLVTGTINGESFEVGGRSGGGRALPSNTETTEAQWIFAGGRGMMTVLPTSEDSFTGWLLWRGEDPLAPPRVYCVEQARITDDDESRQFTVSFDQLKLAGDCSDATPASGQLTVCF